ncbi:DUF4817 domain-containing protein [Trichonephila clavipes]|nr:DUF4817 domain-containing protein [Trichonephila clavipes]
MFLGIEFCGEHPNHMDTQGIFYMPHNRMTWTLSIFCIMKIHRLGPGGSSSVGRVPAQPDGRGRPSAAESLPARPRLLDAPGVRGPAPRRSHHPLPGPRGTSRHSPLHPPSPAPEATPRVQSLRRRTVRQRDVQQGRPHERGGPRGSARLGLPLFRLPRRRHDSRGRSKPLLVPRDAQTPLGGRRQVQLYGDRFNSCQVIYSQFGLAIHQNDHQARRRFVEWAQNKIAVVSDFHKRILFSDEAHFWLNGYVNKQNCRIWSEANPQVYVETPLHPEKLTVWCALWAGAIIDPYFFKNDEGHNVTVNGDRYRAMITNFFIPELNNHDVQELWFQQDSATCHTACATIDLLKDTFGDHLISRLGPVNWPPRSCDLTPLDYFLWGYVKPLVYADKPQTLDHLEGNICRVIADIRPQMLEKVIENWTSRLDYIRASRGSHMPEIIFKM